MLIAERLPADNEFGPTDVRAEFDSSIDVGFHQLVNDKSRRWESTLPAEYWEYRRKWEQHPKERIVGRFPVHLDIEATNACNLLCTMCPRTDMVRSGTFWKVRSFDFDAYRRLIDEGVQNGLCSVKLNILGEPTLNPRLVDMIEYAKQAGVLDVMFNTNATRLDEKMSRRLIDSGLDKLLFSFDSPCRETYNRIRVGADYDQVLANIRRFVEIREEVGSVTPFTRVLMVVTHDNEGEQDTFRQLFEPIVDAVAYGEDCVDPAVRGTAVSPLSRNVSGNGTFCCPQLWQRMFVHPDGVVTVCCIDSMRTLQVGNIFEQSARDIWVGEKYDKLRRLHAEGRFDRIPLCARCPMAGRSPEINQRAAAAGCTQRRSRKPQPVSSLDESRWQ